eukprot:scaffold100788_cov32-Tisochrysis_lutea.AAC.2
MLRATKLTSCTHVNGISTRSVGTFPPPIISPMAFMSGAHCVFAHPYTSYVYSFVPSGGR